MSNNRSHVRPGGSAYVSPEQLVHGTDGKLRWAHKAPGLSRRCLLFTLDETRISRSRVKGRATMDEVTHAFAVWVGGQSQPALRFDPPKTLELSTVRRITATRDRIILKAGSRSFPLLVSPQQFDPIMDFLRQTCPQAAVDDR